MLPQAENLLVVFAGKVTIVHLAVHAGQLKVGNGQIRRKSVLKNLVPLAENLLPLLRGDIPMLLLLIGTGQADGRDELRQSLI